MKDTASFLNQWNKVERPIIDGYYTSLPIAISEVTAKAELNQQMKLINTLDKNNSLKSFCIKVRNSMTLQLRKFISSLKTDWKIYHDMIDSTHFPDSIQQKCVIITGTKSNKQIIPIRPPEKANSMQHFIVPAYNHFQYAIIP